MAENNVIGLDLSHRMNRLLDDIKILFTLPDEEFSSEEKQKYMLQFLDCIVYCAGEEKKRYESMVEQSDHDIVDLEHLYVFKKNEEAGGRSISEATRNVPDKWKSLDSNGLNSALTDTLVRRRSQKDLMTIYDAVYTKVNLAKNVLTHMAVRVYTVGKTTTKRGNGNEATIEISQNKQTKGDDRTQQKSKTF